MPAEELPAWYAAWRGEGYPALRPGADESAQRLSAFEGPRN
jgi:hypothetical protein